MSILDDVEGLSPELKETLQQRIADSFVDKKEFEAVKAKKEELLGETKKAKEAARQAAEAAERKAQEALEQSGDIQALKKFYEEQLNAKTQELEGIKTQTKRQQLASIAAEFVGSKFVDDAIIKKAVTMDFEKRIDMRDGKPVVLDVDGNLTGLSLQDLQNEFLTASVYKPHVIASRASGGGATGGRNGGGAAKVMTKAEFDSLEAKEKMDFMLSKGKITN
jgi:hypothetical protein